MSTVERISDSLSIVVPDSRGPGAGGVADSWVLGRARLVAFKVEHLLSSAQRELGAFGEGELASDLAPDLLRASGHVGEALAVLATLRERLEGPAAGT